MGSSPNFRGASALLRGTSRAFSPKRASRDAPSVCLTGEGSVTPPRRPLPFGPGAAFFPKPKFYSIFLLRPKSRRFAPVGLCTPIFALRAVSSQRLRSETLAAARSAAAVFRVNCREAARGGLLQEKKPPCIKEYGTGSYTSSCFVPPVRSISQEIWMS